MKKIKKLQLAQVILLEKFDNICRKNNIKYSLGYGTLLGAIRHNGFIPWDIDIDVVLTRKEYERFISIFKEDEKFFLQNFKTDKYFGIHISRLMLKETICETPYNKNFNRKKNICIDIFPIDNVSSLFNYYINYFIIKFLTQAKEIKLGRENSVKKINTLFNKIIKLLTKFLKVKTIDKIIEKLLINNAECDTKYLGNYFAYSPYKEIMPREVYSDLIEVEFEGKKYFIIKEYKYYLEKIYGKYEIFPPILEREKIIEKVEKEFYINFGNVQLKEKNTKK